MKLLEPVSEDELQKLRNRRRSSRVSEPIVREFLESGLNFAKVNTPRNPKSLAMTLRQYIRAHNLPIYVHVVDNTLYLERKHAEEAVDLTEEVVDEH